MGKKPDQHTGKYSNPAQVTQKQGREGSEGLQSAGAVSSMLEELKNASSELSRARGALEDALLESSVAAAAPDSSLSTGEALQWNICQSVGDCTQDLTFCTLTASPWEIPEVFESNDHSARLLK